MFRLTVSTAPRVGMVSARLNHVMPEIQRSARLMQTTSRGSTWLIRSTSTTKSSHHRSWSTQQSSANPDPEKVVPPTTGPCPITTQWNRLENQLMRTYHGAMMRWNNYPNAQIRLNHAMSSTHPHSRLGSLEYRSLLQQYIKKHNDQLYNYLGWSGVSWAIFLALDVSWLSCWIPCGISAVAGYHYIRRNQVQMKLEHYDDDYFAAHPPNQ